MDSKETLEFIAKKNDELRTILNDKGFHFPLAIMEIRNDGSLDWRTAGWMEDNFEGMESAKLHFDLTEGNFDLFKTASRLTAMAHELESPEEQKHGRWTNKLRKLLDEGRDLDVDTKILDSIKEQVDALSENIITHQKG